MLMVRALYLYHDNTELAVDYIFYFGRHQILTPVDNRYCTLPQVTIHLNYNSEQSFVKGSFLPYSFDYTHIIPLSSRSTNLPFPYFNTFRLQLIF